MRSKSLPKIVSNKTALTAEILKQEENNILKSNTF